MDQQRLLRAISYVRGGRRVHGQWTRGWSSLVHYLDGVPYAYRTTESTERAVVDIFVAV